MQHLPSRMERRMGIRGASVPYTLDLTSISAKSKNNLSFFSPLASLLPPRDVRLGLISTIKGDHPTDPTA
jgi:hypothetical protein